MEIIKIPESRIGQVDFDNLGFGEVFSDHMFSMEYEDGVWGSHRIIPFGAIEVSPALSSLHYGQIVFEGLKAFRTTEGSINIFRPEKYHERLKSSCRRLCIPEIELSTFMEALKTLIGLDRNWVPHKRGASLYIRPFIFATDHSLGVRVSASYRFLIITSPVDSYYKNGFEPVSLVTSGKYAKAVRGGLGAAKTPANYAATLLAVSEAGKRGYAQVLWLDGVERRYIEEVGAMNIFFLIDDELVTPQLDGTVLDGVTRDTVIQLAGDMGMDVTERRISIDEVIDAAQSGRLKEAFGTGTAAVVTPVGELRHEDITISINNGKTGPLTKSLFEEIRAIQHGERPDRHGWLHPL